MNALKLWMEMYHRTMRPWWIFATWTTSSLHIFSSWESDRYIHVSGLCNCNARLKACLLCQFALKIASLHWEVQYQVQPTSVCWCWSLHNLCSNSVGDFRLKCLLHLSSFDPHKTSLMLKAYFFVLTNKIICCTSNSHSADDGVNSCLESLQCSKCLSANRTLTECFVLMCWFNVDKDSLGLYYWRHWNTIIVWHTQIKASCFQLHSLVTQISSH